MTILSLNPGSSSVKFALYRAEPSHEDCLLRGLVDRLGMPDATLRLTGSDGKAETTPVGATGLTDAVKHAVTACCRLGPVDAVGTRVVHGGDLFIQPTRMDDASLQKLQSLAPLAPLHNPRDVEAIQAARQELPKAPVVAVFDTAFHRTMPTVATTYGLPKVLAAKHKLRRFGFHGISYRYVSELMKSQPEASCSKLVACHLGSGASACAISDGRSIDTSMGMTPLEGLVMGTRSGDIDAGLVLFLEREVHIKPAEIDKILNARSGLAGISGLGGDVRELETSAAEGNLDAKLALEVFAYRVAKYIGAYAAALQGLDAVSFSGGIGENSPSVRKRICDRLSFLGLRLNDAANYADSQLEARRIDDASAVAVWVVKTDEERQIAKETYSIAAAL